MLLVNHRSQTYLVKREHRIAYSTSIRAAAVAYLHMCIFRPCTRTKTWESHIPRRCTSTNANSMTANFAGADGNARVQGNFAKGIEIGCKRGRLLASTNRSHTPASSPRAGEDVYSLQVNTIHHPLPRLSGRDRVRRCGKIRHRDAKIRTRHIFSLLHALSSSERRAFRDNYTN